MGPARYSKQLTERTAEVKLAPLLDGDRLDAVVLGRVNVDGSIDVAFGDSADALYIWCDQLGRGIRLPWDSIQHLEVAGSTVRIALADNDVEPIRTFGPTFADGTVQTMFGRDRAALAAGTSIPLRFACEPSRTTVDRLCARVAGAGGTVTRPS
jgi:hypothetical protein